MIFTKKQLKQIFSGNTEDKMIKRHYIFTLTMVIFMTASVINAQKLVESVAGVIGSEVIFLSDIENGIVQQQLSGNKTPVDKLRCQIFEEEMVAKLFLDQARIDSIEVSNASVDGNLNLQLNRYIAMVGSEKALEDYFRKSISEIRADLRKSLKNQQIISQVQGNIAENITVSPSEVKKFRPFPPKWKLASYR